MISFAGTGTVYEFGPGFALNVVLSAPASTPVTFTVATQDVTATAGSDYQGLAPTVMTIPAGTISGSVFVPILEDTEVEPDETFQIVVSNPSGATLGDSGVFTWTIWDDEPTVSIFDATGGEGSTYNNRVRFLVTLGGPCPTQPSAPITVNYAVSFDSSDTASSADLGATSGSLTFQPGESVKNLDIPVIDDNLVEDTERFTITLTSAAGSHIATPDNGGTAIGWIADDDPAVPLLAANDDFYEMANDEVLIVSPSDADWIGANDIGSPRTYSLDPTSLPSTSIAIITLTTDGTLTVDPDDDFDGDIEFRYLLSDGVGTVSADVKIEKWTITIQNKWTESASPSTVSGKTFGGNVRTTELYIGEEVNLNAVFKKGAAGAPPLDAELWVVPGTIKLDYLEDVSEGRVINVGQSHFESDSMTFFWVNPGMRTVTYSYILTGDPKKTTREVTAKFDVKGPEVTAAATSTDWDGVRLLTAANNAATPGMQLGNNGETSGQAGMFFSMPTVPAGYSRNQFSFRQIIDSTINTKQTDDGRFWTMDASNVLDGGLTARPFDSPSRSFLGATSFRTRDDFTTWVMWKSSDNTRIRHNVGVAKVSWFWEAEVIRTSDATVPLQNATYDFVRDSNGSPTWDHSLPLQLFTTGYALPEWKGNIKDYMTPPDPSGIVDLKWEETL